MINKEMFYEQFIWLLVFCVNYEECDYVNVDLSVEFLYVDNWFIVNELLIVLDINVEYGLCSVFCLNDENVWMCCSDDMMRFYNFKGELVKLVYIKLKNVLYDIVVIKSGDFVYIDNIDKIVNLVKNIKI